MKDSTKNLVLALLLIAAPFAYAAYVYPSLPDTIPTHFNIKGEADAYGGKDSIFLGPGIMAIVGLFVFILISNLKSFDPKRYKARRQFLSRVHQCHMAIDRVQFQKMYNNQLRYLCLLKFFFLFAVI